jgi:hypothetical protein
MRRAIAGFGLAGALLATACHGSGARGGGGGPYTPQNQPAVNPYGTPGPVEAGGRVEREEGGPNAGAYHPTPPEGERGSGSAYHRTPGQVSPSSAAPKRGR